LTLLVGRHEGHPACKKLEWWGTGMVICLEQDADLHMAQLIPLPLTFSCFSKIQIGFTFLVPAHAGSPGKRAVKRVCVYLDQQMFISLTCSSSFYPLMSYVIYVTNILTYVVTAFSALTMLVGRQKGHLAQVSRKRGH